MLKRSLIFFIFCIFLYGLIGCSKLNAYPSYEEALIDGLGSYNLDSENIAYSEQFGEETLIIYHPLHNALGFAFIEKEKNGDGYVWNKPETDIAFDTSKPIWSIKEISSSNRDYYILVGSFTNAQSDIEVTGTESTVKKSSGLFFSILDENDDVDHIDVSFN